MEAGFKGAKQQQGLHLASFSSNLPYALGIVSLLPAQRLTSLELQLGRNREFDGRALSAALAQLSNLQELCLDGESSICDGGLPYSCLPGIAELSQLTYLKIAGDSHDEGMHLEQLLVQPLPLRVLHLDWYRISTLDLSQLAHLQEVITQPSSRLDGAWVYPPQVKKLRLGWIYESAGVAALTGVQQLEQLSFQAVCYHDTDEQPLLGLVQLPALQHLALKFEDVHEVAEAAVALTQLQTLRELTTIFRWHTPSYEQWANVLAAVAACTGLTRLVMDAGAIENPLPAPQNWGEVREPVAACDSLAGLTNLKDLEFCEYAKLVPGDALALTALTGLTRLVLKDAEQGVGDLAACALACSLKQLRHLNLQACDLGGMACLGAIAHLTQLTELRLEVNDGLTQQGLMLLSRLTNLQQLGVDQHLYGACRLRCSCSKL